MGCRGQCLEKAHSNICCDGNRLWHDAVALLLHNAICTAILKLTVQGIGLTCATAINWTQPCTIHTQYTYPYIDYTETYTNHPELKPTEYCGNW